MPALQIAIAPMILISGVGLLLLSLTNRLGRAVDRTRELRHKMEEAAPANRRRLAHEVELIYHRARLLQTAIVLGALSALFAALLVLTLFLTALWKWDSAAAITVFFIACLVSLIGSLVTFIMEVHRALLALKVELSRRQEE